jgi:hypothetical protein
MDLTDFGWRDGILVAVVLTAIYLVMLLLRLAKLRHRSPVVESIAAPSWSSEHSAALSPEIRREEAAPPFAERLAWVDLSQDLKQLREEVAGLRRDLEEVKAARRVSPIYAEAVALAHRGFDARGVAEECGISVAEAELVLALSRDDKTLDSEVDHGGDGKQVAAGRPER